VSEALSAHPYIPNSAPEIKRAMLDAIGVNTVEELYGSIPERLRVPGLLDLHPLQTDESTQGMLELLWELQNILAEIAGLDAVSLQPAAGAQGELTALLVAAAYFRDRGETRTRVLVPDSAHGDTPCRLPTAT